MSVPKTDALPLGDAPTVGGLLAKVVWGRKGHLSKTLQCGRVLAGLGDCGFVAMPAPVFFVILAAGDAQVSLTNQQRKL